MAGLEEPDLVGMIAEARATEHAAAIEQLVLAARWATHHPTVSGDPLLAKPAGWSDPAAYQEEPLALAGPGTPQVAEYALLALGAALGVDPETAKALVGDALELSCRLPALWSMLCDGLVVPWKARRVARATTALDADHAADVDRRVSAVVAARNLSLYQLTRVTNEAIWATDPDRAQAAEDAALHERAVHTRRRISTLTGHITIIADAEDVDSFEEAVSTLAARLKTLGDTTPLQVRRARAVGILSVPGTALTLLDPARETASPTGRGDVSAPGSIRGPVVARPREVVVHVHLTLADLATTSTGAPPSTGCGRVASIEGEGPISLRRLRDRIAHATRAWLGPADATTITVKPVLDPRTAGAVDAHDPPPWLRELVTTTDATCVFPGCHHDSRRCDLDHVDPWRDPAHGGPPGDQRRQPRAAVPTAPPPQDLQPLALPPHTHRLRVALTGRRDVPRRPPPQNRASHRLSGFRPTVGR